MKKEVTKIDGNREATKALLFGIGLWYVVLAILAVMSKLQI